MLSSERLLHIMLSLPYCMNAKAMQCLHVHRVRKKVPLYFRLLLLHLLVDFYNLLLKTEINTPQSHKIYLLNGLMTSYL